MRLVKLLKSEWGRIVFGASFFALALVFDFLSDSFAIKIVASVFYILALLVAGLPIFIDAVRGILRRDLLDEKFLMCIASIGAIIIGDMSEGVAVMLFFVIGEYFEHKAVRKSRNSIRSLMSIKPDEARVLSNGEEELVDAEDIEIGAEILIKNGERVPIDCIVISGGAEIDASALTGESLPRSVTEGDELSSGCLVVNGFIVCRTVRLAEESAAARILELVENANENKSQEERFITKFSRVYTPVVVLCAVIMAVIPPLLIDKYTFTDSLYAALTFLVISCPCALVISVPMAFFGAIGGAASKGILFKGGNFVSSLAHADVVAFDKTGTLTEGKFSVLRVEAVTGNEEELMFYAASAEYGSTHPLAEGIKSCATRLTEPTDYKELPGMGVIAKVSGVEVAVGNSKLFKMLETDIPDALGGELFVSVDAEYRGRIFLTDVIKNEAERSLNQLRDLGVNRVAMLTGDSAANAIRIDEELKIDEIRCELLPSEKYDFIIDYKKKSRAVVFVGDGINDAPSLVAADVGIAMGGVGSDSAIEAADVVIMTDNLSKIPTAIRIARKTITIAKMNIVLAIGIKLAILLLGAVGFANMWLAVFADVGVAVIAILNSMRTLKIKE